MFGCWRAAFILFHSHLQKQRHYTLIFLCHIHNSTCVFLILFHSVVKVRPGLRSPLVLLSSDASGISQSELLHTAPDLLYICSGILFCSFLPQATRTVPTHTHSLLNNMKQTKAKTAALCTVAAATAAQTHENMLNFVSSDILRQHFDEWKSEVSLCNQNKQVTVLLWTISLTPDIIQLFQI